jgi:hypothetical protein
LGIEARTLYASQASIIKLDPQSLFCFKIESQ